MKKIIFPPSEKILYLKGFDNYTEFHLTDMPKEVSSYTLKKYQKQHTHFLRITRAHLINPSFIRKIYDLGRTKAVELCNGEIIVASRRRKEILKTFRDWASLITSFFPAFWLMSKPIYSLILLFFCNYLQHLTYSCVFRKSKRLIFWQQRTTSFLM